MKNNGLIMGKKGEKYASFTFTVNVAEKRGPN